MSVTLTTLSCNAEETDVNFPSSSTLDVQFSLPNGTLLPLGWSGNGKHIVISSLVARTNRAILYLANPAALDTENYTCIASTAPPTTNISATARLEVKGNFLKFDSWM